MGPVLHIWGKDFPHIYMPYSFLKIIFPIISLSGCPIRMIIMTILSASVISAIGFQLLLQRNIMKMGMAAITLLALLFEYLPSPIPAIQMPVPKYVYFLKELPAGYGVLDFVNTVYTPLYYQTIHEKPVVFAHTSRIPASVLKKDQMLRNIFNKKQYHMLYNNFNIRYIIVEAKNKLTDSYPPVPLIYDAENVKIYDLGK
ncbi:MAG: hypothetical protein A2161_15350 [Candidatus Schekmanbacteria bacterium RBG_13_48_7]|uniref:Glycosyltransferase RgtA/B/C/D-like domain-containing protein n=1 Tax=Candidatus Schekmanbacteria bacterium RBG_13_48_7 TaxID=1817878 RepID=A0A1F7S3S4_9BACT|nr:MAG: hypothetical protein A2161_15350 [Candidatus Schekmanbacteria bacterium RBG_13_48_7]